MLQIILLAETRLSSYVCRTVTDLQVLKQTGNNVIGVSVLGGRSLFSPKYRKQLLTYTQYLFSCLKITQLLILPVYCVAAHMPWLPGVSIFSVSMFQNLKT